MIKTWGEEHSVKDVTDLKKGMDFRRPEYRKEVFFRLYAFHTSLGIHPGLVYLFLPKLAEHENWDVEQKLWAAFIEGFCENPCTLWAITREFPRLPRTSTELKSFERWHSEHWRQLDYDRDTRYNKGHSLKQIESYVQNLSGLSQFDFFHEKLYDSDAKKWFDNVWGAVNLFYKFGRLTSWSYLEFIKIITGFGYTYSSLMMNDSNGSKSHRNGCLKVMGRDDLEWYPQAGNGVTNHAPEIYEATEVYGRNLTEELKVRFKDEPWVDRIGYETVESALCVFKNCFHGERYPNVYTDMSYDRIKKAEILWDGKIDFSIFWKIRKENLPEKLLLELNLRDPGLKPIKQRWFRTTGQLPMLSVIDPVFECDWDSTYYGNEEDSFFKGD